MQKARGALRTITSYGVTAVAVAAAFFLREGAQSLISSSLPPFILFYPTVMTVAILAGIGPGLLGTALCAAATTMWIFPPLGQFAIATTSQVLSLALFSGMGVFMSFIAELYRRARRRSAELERELSVRDSQRLLRTVIDLVPHFIFAKDRNSRHIFVNRACAEANGRTPEEMVGLSDLDLQEDPAEAESFMKDDREVIDTGTQKIIPEERLTDARGRTRVLHTTKMPFVLPGTSETALVGVAVDITELKLAGDEIRALNAGLERRVQERTAELEAANKELDSFAYAVSHDLRAPIRALNGFSKALVEDYAPSLAPEARDFVDQIVIAATRMGELIEGLLKLSRSTRGELKREIVDLSELVERILSDLSLTDPARHVEWTVESGLTARGDPRLLEAVLANLLGNAWKYTGGRDDARIRFFAERSDGERFFCVSDNGAGFDMKHAARLFQPFQRLHREDEFPGIGIGLATVQRIILRHGGVLQARGEPGAGATFSFSLPFQKSGDKESP